MRFAVSGSRGSGKTTIVALMARMLAREGVKVLALDAAASPMLAVAIGIPPSERARIRPLSAVYERVGNDASKPKADIGDVLRKDPVVADMTETLSVEGPDKVEVLVLGNVQEGAEPALLRRVMDHLLLEEDEVVLLDMEADLRHLDQRTARSLDGVLILVLPDMESMRVADAIKQCAIEMGVGSLKLVANKVVNGQEKDEVARYAGEMGLDLLAAVPRNDNLVMANREGRAVIDIEGIDDVKEAAHRLKSMLIKR